ncbi:hypothetical protein [Massilia oculi]|uniref:hypothetical protein n=1 Tax=Massilia oculi TaxID=945844 RepID=UPI0028B2418B|nr:hypothetical protein [Massilia oculi]
MKHRFKPVLVIFSMAMFAAPAHAEAREASTEQAIKRQIIEESIASYPGRCPCPYNVTRNGSACGGRSAWSRKGGYAPICYEKEVTQEAVRARLTRDRKAPGEASGPTSGR